MGNIDDLQDLKIYLPTKDSHWQEIGNIPLKELQFALQCLRVQDLTEQEQLLLNMLEQVCEAYYACKEWAYKPTDF